MSEKKTRTAKINRSTKETDIKLELDLDGTGRVQVETGIGFFNHMLESLGRHSLLDLQISCRGDLDVDEHHTVEDVGICLGQAIDEALGDKRGINRFGYAYAPLDEALSRVVIDISGRPYIRFQAELSGPGAENFHPGIVQEFFRAVASSARLTCHVELISGSDFHHQTESIFKAFALALREAVKLNPRVSGVPSTKGLL